MGDPSFGAPGRLTGDTVTSGAAHLWLFDALTVSVAGERGGR
ncbi:hypothetical protein [Nocardia sp. MW-W600-9]